MKSPLRLSLFTRWHEDCGISVYSKQFVQALQTLPNFGSYSLVEPPPSTGRIGTKQAIRHYRQEERRFRELGERLGKQDADIAHIQHQYFFFGGVAPHKNHTKAFLDAVRLPTVMTVHEIAEPPASGSPLTRLALSHVNRKNFLHPVLRRLLVHTEQDRLRLLDIGVDEAKIRLVRHGIPAPIPLPPKEVAKAELGLSGRRVLTLFGYLSNKKGHPLAVEALSHLPEETVLLFAGGRHPEDETGYVAQVEALVASLNLQSRVRFTGYIPDGEIARYLAATDLALVPFAQTSGSGSLSLMLANGIPVAASRIMPHKEILQDTPDSLALLPSFDPREVALSLQSLLFHEEALANLSRGASQYALRHSYLEMAKETMQVYEEVLEKKQ